MTKADLERLWWWYTDTIFQIGAAALTNKKYSWLINTQQAIQKMLDYLDKGIDMKNTTELFLKLEKGEFLESYVMSTGNIAVTLLKVEEGEDVTIGSNYAPSFEGALTKVLSDAGRV